MMRWVCLFVFLFSNVVFAEVTVTLTSTMPEQPQKTVGTVIFKNTMYGLLIIPDLHGLTPGLHGFHLHDKPSCKDHGMDASGHYDPKKTGKHLGPYDAHGHLGDLPALYVDSKGDALLPVLAPRLREKDLYGHAIMIHAGGDNYSDQPKPQGGGGDRVACGIINDKDKKSMD